MLIVIGLSILGGCVLLGCLAITAAIIAGQMERTHRPWMDDDEVSHAL